MTLEAFMDQEEITDKYLSYILDWNDPFETPVVVQHEGVSVVRDDLLTVSPGVPCGSKVRFFDALLHRYSEIEEWVYGSSPACGYAQISLPAACRVRGSESHIFMAKRDPKNYHEYQKRGIELGGIYHWVPNGMLNVTEARAREYVNEQPSRRKLVEIGGDHPVIIGSVIKVARSMGVVPDVVWSSGSSGTLTRGLQYAWPDAEVHVVQVGHKMKPEQIGRAEHHVADYDFFKAPEADLMPPFPSVAEYDAKAWIKMVEYYAGEVPEKNVLFWNVGG